MIARSIRRWIRSHVKTYLRRCQRATSINSFSTAATDPVVLGLLVACVAGVAAFVGVEKRTPEPMLKLRYFRRRNFTMPMAASSLLQFAYMGGFVVTPALLGGLYGLSVGAIALTMTPRPGAFSLASPVGGYLATSLGERKPIVIGAVAMIASMIAFAFASTMAGALGITIIVVGLVASGVSAGISQPAVASMVAGAVDAQDMGIANGMNQQVMFIGIVSGIQTMNILVGDSAGPGRFAATFAVGLVVAGAGLAAALGIRSDDRSF